MAELTPNGKLRVSANLDADSRFNLFKLDSLFASGLFDSTSNLILKTANDIVFRPGDGNGGSFLCNHKLDNFSINATTLTLNDDIAFAGNWTLEWTRIDKTGASVLDFSDFDAEVINNVNVSANTTHRGRTDNPHSVTAAQVGSYTIAQVDVLLATKADSSHTHVAADITDFDTEVSNNTDVAAATNHIAQSSIHFTEASISHGNIQNVGTNSHDDIDNHIGSTGNPHNVTAAQTGADTSAEVSAKVSSHAALTSGIHGVAGSLVGTTDNQSLTNKTIDADQNSLSNIDNDNIKAAAGIEGSKIDPDFGNQVIKTAASLQFEEGGFTTDLRGAQSGQAANLTFDLPAADGTGGQVLATNGSGELFFTTVAGSTLLPEFNIRVGNSSNQQEAVDTVLNGDISASTANGLLIKADVIDNANINSSAAIEYSKMAALTINRVLISSGSGELTVSAVTSTELGYLEGVTSAIQTQIDGKQDTITGAASTVVSSDLDPSIVAVSNGSGKIVSSSISTTELGTLDGVSSNIQTQLNGKEPTITGAATSITGSDLAIDRAVISDGSGKVAVSAATSTEVGYLSGVSSNIQTQLNGKEDTITGAASTITGSDLTAERVAISNGSGKIDVSAITTTELGYLDGATSNIQTQIDNLGSAGTFKADWLNADGATKVVTHSLGTRDVMVELYDSVTFETILIDSVVRTDTNTVTLTASQAPDNTVRVLIKEI